MSFWLNIAFKCKHGLIIFEKIVAAGSLLLLLILAMVQIIARNFFEVGFSEMAVVSRHLILFIIFMGAALVSEQNQHIKIDILNVFLTTEQKKILVVPLLLLSALVSAIFAWYAGLFWLDEWHYAPLNERWSVYLALILPIGFFILALHLFLLTLTGFEHERVLSEKAVDSNLTYSCSDIE